MLYRLVSRPVFSIAHRVVREHENGGQFHQRRQPDRRPRVVAEDEERRAVWSYLRAREPIQDGSHGVLTDAEVQVLSARVAGLKMPGPLISQKRFIRWAEIARP